MKELPNQPRKESKYFIDPLAQKLHIEDITSKRILAALTFNTLITEGDGITDNNVEQIREKFRHNLCDEYTFRVFELAAKHDNLALLLCMKVTGIDVYNLYEDYILPFLRSTEVIPGVRFE